MRKPPLLAFAALFAVSLSAAPFAAEAMVVPIDHTARLSVPGSAASVVVGNPAVADVTVVDSHTVFVMGRGYGSTDVVVLDRAGRTLYAGDITVAAAGANVTVYRGRERANYACLQHCSEAVAPSSATTTAPTGAAGLIGALANAVGANAAPPSPPAAAVGAP